MRQRWHPPPRPKPGYLAAHAQLYGNDVRRPAAQGRQDANATAIREAYEALYCSYVDTHDIGGGFGDAVIGCAGRTEVIEIKTEDGKIRPSQETFAKTWRGSKIRLIRNAEDVVEHVTEIRTKQARLL